MDIQDWQRAFVLSMKAKFPQEFSVEQRLLALHRQVADVSHAVQFGGDVKHRIASIFPDLFRLCEDFEINLDEELPVVLEWFNSDKPRR